MIDEYARFFETARRRFLLELFIDLAGVVGGVGGILSKRKKAFGVANLCATYAANLSIVTGCYCGNPRVPILGSLFHRYHMSTLESPFGW